MSKLTNEQKYKTAEERVKAFGEFCERNVCDKSCAALGTRNPNEVMTSDCMAYWLALESEEEKPEPCPFCGGKMQLMLEQNNDTHCLVCNGGCGYTTGAYASEVEAISWHNRVARAVRAARESEAK